MKQKYGLFLPSFIYALGVISYYIILLFFAGEISVFAGVFIALACLIGGKYIDKRAHLGGFVLLFVLLLGSGALCLTYKGTTEVDNIFAWFNVMSGVAYGSVSASVIMLFVSSAAPILFLLLGSKLSKKTVEIKNLASTSKRIAAGILTALLMLILVFCGMGVAFVCSTDTYEDLTHPAYKGELAVFEHKDEEGIVYFAINTDSNNQYAVEIIETPFLFIKSTNRYIYYSGGGLTADGFHFAVDNIVRDESVRYLAVFSSNVSSIARLDYTLGNEQQKTIVLDKNKPFAEFIPVSPAMCDDGNSMNYEFYAYDENDNLIGDYISATYV